MTDANRDSGFFTESLSQRDAELFGAITSELGRQRHEIELIASENIVSRAVMEAQGSVMTNKYAEGYPGKRYYGGCEYVDVAENLAIDRACKLFGATYANVQPNSGSQANQGVFQALIQPGDTILGMSLDAGGHLTHGAAPNQSGKWFKSVQYGVRKQDSELDYAQVEALAKEHNPKLIIAGGSAYPRQIDFAGSDTPRSSRSRWRSTSAAPSPGTACASRRRACRPGTPGRSASIRSAARARSG